MLDGGRHGSDAEHGDSTLEASNWLSVNLSTGASVTDSTDMTGRSDKSVSDTVVVFLEATRLIKSQKSSKYSFFSDNCSGMVRSSSEK